MNQEKLLSLFISYLLLTFSLFFHDLKVEASQATGLILANQATKGKQLWITSKHSEHEVLKQNFKSGPEVTKACLTCHNQAAIQFHKTIHWTWMDPSTEKSAKFGKGGLSINNF